VVLIRQTYQPFGMGGVIAPNDGTAWLAHSVIAPHYAGMVASISPIQASALWDWLETVECPERLVEAQSSDAGLGTAAGHQRSSPVQATWAIDLLRQGYVAMLMHVYLPVILKG
jgi:hypothetical protein